MSRRRSRPPWPTNRWSTASPSGRLPSSTAKRIRVELPAELVPEILPKARRRCIPDDGEAELQDFDPRHARVRVEVRFLADFVLELDEEALPFEAPAVPPEVGPSESAAGAGNPAGIGEGAGVRAAPARAEGSRDRPDIGIGAGDVNRGYVVLIGRTGGYVEGVPGLGHADGVGEGARPASTRRGCSRGPRSGSPAAGRRPPRRPPGSPRSPRPRGSSRARRRRPHSSGNSTDAWASKPS